MLWIHRFVISSRSPLFIQLLAVHGGNSAGSHGPFNIIINLVFLTVFSYNGILVQ